MDLHSKLIQKTQQYQMPAKALELLQKNKPLLLAGVSAAGKTSVVNQIVKQGSGEHVITHTTRQPRINEKNGVNYWFVDEEEMLKIIDNNGFIEVNLVHGDTVYGTSIAAYEKVLISGKLPILTIDVQGIDDLAKAVPGLQAKFILPPDANEWLSRLSKREIMTSVDRHRRTVSAKLEIEKALSDNHYDLVVNRDISEAADEVIHGSSDMMRKKLNQQIARNLLEQIRSY
jgi:guanylate kinase